MLYRIGQDEVLKRRLVDDPGLIARAKTAAQSAVTAFEESLRLRPPFHFFRRTVAVETELAGQRLTTGDAVLVSFAAANRDPARFADPEQFNPDRAEWKHLTFGHGIHLCAGATLARTQLRLASTRILERLPDYRPTIVDTDIERLGLVDSMQSLPVEFPPARSARHVQDVTRAAVVRGHSTVGTPLLN
ncbi:cytochrome P450 [Mycobacterium sp.]|uniref:cytochrome P450 n=1 Tax=Mycobacterium sp. TaxID=1785 RepID=UPI003D151421